VRAQPAAIQPPPAPGHADDQRGDCEQRHEQVEEDVAGRLERARLAGEEGVEAEPPLHAEQPGVVGVEVVAEEVEDRRQDEEREEADLHHGAQALRTPRLCRVATDRGDRNDAARAGDGGGRDGRGGWTGHDALAA